MRRTRMMLNSRFVLNTLLVSFVLALAACPASGQVQLGTPKYGSFGGGPVDMVNLGNLNTHFIFPVLHKPGRGLPLNFDLTYDNTFWEPVSSGGTLTWYPGSNWGWSGSALNVGSIISTVRGYDYQYYFSCATFYFDGFGTPHVFTGGWLDPNWTPNLWGCALYDYYYGIDYAQTGSVPPDGSGYTFN